MTSTYIDAVTHSMELEFDVLEGTRRYAQLDARLQESARSLGYILVPPIEETILDQRQQDVSDVFNASLDHRLLGIGHTAIFREAS